MKRETFFEAKDEFIENDSFIWDSPKVHEKINKAKHTNSQSSRHSIWNISTF